MRCYAASIHSEKIQDVQIERDINAYPINQFRVGHKLVSDLNGISSDIELVSEELQFN